MIRSQESRTDPGSPDTVEADDIPPYGGPWFDSPFFAQLLDRSDLSPGQRDEVARFAREGCLVLDRDRLGISDFDALAQRILRETSAIYRGAGRVQDAWMASAAVRELALAPGILGLLERLYQREPVPFQTLNFPRGSEYSAHSDTFHVHCLPKFFVCGVWVALEDTNEDNGPLYYYPGSHRLADVDVLDLDAAGMLARRAGGLEASYSRFVERMLAASDLPVRRLAIHKGQALVWAANLYHGSEPVRDHTRTRHSQVIHYHFKDCLYYSPMRSDPARGRLAIRRVRNIRTGRYEPLRYHGRRIPVSLGERLHWYGPRVIQGLRAWRWARTVARCGQPPAVPLSPGLPEPASTRRCGRSAALEVPKSRKRTLDG